MATSDRVDAILNASMSEPVSEFSITIDQVQDYQFLVKFDKPQGAELHTDEGPPLGKDAGPNPSRMLAAAIGNCLGASLMFACGKSGVKLSRVHADVNVQIVRNEKRRLRVGRVQVSIDPGFTGDEAAKAKSARDVFEDFCTVTQSIRDGIAVEVKVKGIDG